MSSSPAALNHCLSIGGLCIRQREIYRYSKDPLLLVFVWHGDRKHLWTSLSQNNKKDDLPALFLVHKENCEYDDDFAEGWGHMLLAHSLRTSWIPNVISWLGNNNNNNHFYPTITVDYTCPGWLLQERHPNWTANVAMFTMFTVHRMNKWKEGAQDFDKKTFWTALVFSTMLLQLLPPRRDETWKKTSTPRFDRATGSHKLGTLPGHLTTKLILEEWACVFRLDLMWMSLTSSLKSII